MYHAAVLTVSDRVSRGERPDEGGPLVAELLKKAGSAFGFVPVAGGMRFWMEAPGTGR